MKNNNTKDESELLTAKELSEEIFRCNYFTFMKEIKSLDGFPVPVGNPNKRGRLHWIKKEVIEWRNEHYRRVS